MEFVYFPIKDVVNVSVCLVLVDLIYSPEESILLFLSGLIQQLTLLFTYRVKIT